MKKSLIIIVFLMSGICSCSNGEKVSILKVKVDRLKEIDRLYSDSISRSIEGTEDKIGRIGDSLVAYQMPDPHPELRGEGLRQQAAQESARLNEARQINAANLREAQNELDKLLK